MPGIPTRAEQLVWFRGWMREIREEWPIHLFIFSAIMAVMFLIVSGVAWFFTTQDLLWQPIGDWIMDQSLSGAAGAAAFAVFFLIMTLRRA